MHYIPRSLFKSKKTSDIEHVNSFVYEQIFILNAAFTKTKR